MTTPPVIITHDNGKAEDISALDATQHWLMAGSPTPGEIEKMLWVSGNGYEKIDIDQHYDPFNINVDAILYVMLSCISKLVYERRHPGNPSSRNLLLAAKNMADFYAENVVFIDEDKIDDLSFKHHRIHLWLVGQFRQKVSQEGAMNIVAHADQFESSAAAARYIEALNACQPRRRFITVSVGFHDKSFIIDALLGDGWRLKTSTGADDSDGRRFQLHNFTRKG